mmetsp:Transcript_10331/g.28125  ORF Transcript_10331/g.28125 Transcript_10331/m.28125 type:complete len:228 (+) Transcript_10331:2363-3046(+)
MKQHLHTSGQPFVLRVPRLPGSPVVLGCDDVRELGADKLVDTCDVPERADARVGIFHLRQQPQGLLVGHHAAHGPRQVLAPIRGPLDQIHPAVSEGRALVKVGLPDRGGLDVCLFQMWRESFHQIVPVERVVGTKPGHDGDPVIVRVHQIGNVRHIGTFHAKIPSHFLLIQSIVHVLLVVRRQHGPGQHLVQARRAHERRVLQGSHEEGQETDGLLSPGLCSLRAGV